MQIPSLGGGLTTIAGMAATLFLLGWRFESWIKKHLSAIVTEQVNEGVRESLKPLNTEVAGHTKQMAAVQQRLNQHQRQIIQLAWAGAETTASAAIWAKKVPSAREVELQTQDWRNIVTNVDPDENAT